MAILRRRPLDRPTLEEGELIQSLRKRPWLVIGSHVFEGYNQTVSLMHGQLSETQTMLRGHYPAVRHGFIKTKIKQNQI